MLVMGRLMFRVGRSGDGSICVPLMRERQKESERDRVPVPICPIYHSAAFLFSGSFEAHWRPRLIRSSPPSVFVHSCM